MKIVKKLLEVQIDRFFNGILENYKLVLEYNN